MLPAVLFIRLLPPSTSGKAQVRAKEKALSVSFEICAFFPPEALH